MKKTITRTLLVLVLLSTPQCPVFAQGPAFTYQGKLESGGNAASGVYDFTFALWDAGVGGTQQGAIFATNGVAVSNGYFAATPNCGNVFTGKALWLEIAVRTNGGSGFATLNPRQPLMPAPYAMLANTASNLSGTLAAAQLTGAIPASQLSGTAGAATNFTGALAGDVTGTQGATVVASVGGQSALNVASGVIAGNAATSVYNTYNLVKRDGTGSFAAGSLTLNGNLNLPATSASAGVIYSDGAPLIQAFGAGNLFAGGAGNFGMTGGNNTGIGGMALANNASGSNNVGNGMAALNHNSAGNDNTANGYWALLMNTTGSGNTANGYNALMWNGTGSFNTADGQQALALNGGGSNNIALGYQAGYNIFGDNNIDIGNQGVSSDANIIRIGSGQTNTYVAGNSVHIAGMLRLGSEANTGSGPNYPPGSTGLIVRRILCISSVSNTIVAATDVLTLIRDGTPSGLNLACAASAQFQSLACTGIDRNGNQVIRQLAMRYTSGWTVVFSDAQRVVHYDISFGNPYVGGHTCHVVLDRYDDGSTSDNWLAGTVTTTYNQ